MEKFLLTESTVACQSRALPASKITPSGTSCGSRLTFFVPCCHGTASLKKLERVFVLKKENRRRFLLNQWKPNFAIKMTNMQFLLQFITYRLLDISCFKD